jgi:hypothetical protein
MKEWQSLKADIDAATAAMQLVEPEELYNIRHACVGNEAGSYDHLWAPIDFVNGMIRDLPGYTMYPYLKLAYDKDFDLSHLRKIYVLMHPPYTEYLGYSGMFQLREFGRRIVKAFDEFESKEELIELYTSFLIYVNKLAAWAYHYFTWDLGYKWKPEPVEKN